MKPDRQFAEQLTGKRLTTVEVLYFMPDYHDLLQQFVWQTLDLPPTYPRVNRFLWHWHDNIGAVIKEIKIASANHIMPARFSKVDGMVLLN